MKIKHKMETVLVAISGILCTILILKLIYKLRSILPWRVNCWFCNNYSWVKFPIRNSWNCPKCEQYNGFTKDGDYNKPIFVGNDQAAKSKVFQSSPPRNGLCKMCNINQQLKVTQLANFVPMNDKKFDEEIESYRLQLEKAYKLCTSCKKFLQMKLHKEKETLLGTKLLEARTPEKQLQKKEMKNKKLQNFTNSISMVIAGILLILVSIECYKNVMKSTSLHSTINNIKEILSGLLERIMSIVKMKISMTFPSIERYFDDINTILYFDILPKHFYFTQSLVDVNMKMQQALGGFVSLIQIIGHCLNINELKYAIVIDSLWSIFVITSIAHQSVAIDPTIISFIKLSSTLAVLFVYRSMRRKVVRPVARTPTTPKRMKNLINQTVNSLIDEEDTVAVDSDDDVSLSKYGLHNYSESSNETTSLLNNSITNGRSFTPRGINSMWSKPKVNSTFCITNQTQFNNTVLSKSPSSISDTLFVKPSFNKYQKLSKDDSDSDLDESIGSLCISSPKKTKQNSNSIFSLRKFTASPSFVAPTPMSRSRPLISPSKLGHSTSWVAGGYWGTESERQIFNLNGSRSSSQSSGFESQASSMTQRNVFSQPPSREESVFGEPDKSSMLDRFQNCNMSNYGNQVPQHFSRMSSPVFPQMQYNSHIHIPQPRFAQQNGLAQNVFAHQQPYTQNGVFKAPGSSGLIKLPQTNSFMSR